MTDQATQDRHFYTVENDGAFLIKEVALDAATEQFATDRQTAWNRARAQYLPVTFVSLAGERRQLGVVAPAPSPVTEDGLYVLNDDAVKVIWNQTHTRLYAKTLVDGHWDYAAGLVRQLNTSMKMTADQAKAFGALYGRCVSFSRELTNEISIYWGYGETCAQNNGWPWYDVPEAHVTGE